MEIEYSEAGTPIYRHKARETKITPPNMNDSSMEEIGAHIEKHIGEISMVWHEIVSDLVHIDVHQIAPTDERPFWTLVTSGMSDLPMTTPPKAENFKYCELMICLPKEWKMDEESFKDERYYWPVRWLKICALFPHKYQTWLGWKHTLPNGDPPKPFIAGIGFCCMYLGIPRSVAREFWKLEVRPDKTINFLALYPIYAEEIALKLKKGADSLEELFDQKQINEIVNVRRANLVKKPWWKVF